MEVQVVVSADILVLNETVSFTREAELAGSASTAIVPVSVARLACRASLSSLVGQQQCMPSVAAADESLVRLILVQTAAARRLMVGFNESYQTIAITETVDAEL